MIYTLSDMIITLGVGCVLGWLGTIYYIIIDSGTLRKITKK